MKISFFKKPLGIISSICIVLIGCSSLCAPLISPYKPDAIDVTQRLQSPSYLHVLGTDHLGRDVFTRLLYGGRISLASVAVIIASICTISIFLGSIAGYFGGWIDSLIMRICDAFMTFPTFILALFLIGILGTGMTNVVIAIVLSHWAWYCRIVRSIVLSYKNKEYILASKVCGTGSAKIILTHLLPVIGTQLVILASMDIGHMILHVSGLSFLGLGIQPPIPEWGVMINDGRQFLRMHPGMVIFPGMMIFFSVMAFNLLGDAIRDYLDPSVQKEVH